MRGLYSRNQYSSSISTVFTLLVDIVSGFSVRMAFFYPIHYIGFVHSQNFSHTSAADSPVVHFDCQFFGFFRILMAFWLNGVIYAALLTLAALAPRAVAPCFHLVFYLSTFRAFLPCLYRLFSHIPYYSIIALVWTLPNLGHIAGCRGYWYRF